MKIITEVDFEVECLTHPDDKTREKAALNLGIRIKEKSVALPALKKALETELSVAVKEQITKSISRLEKGE